MRQCPGDSGRHAEDGPVITEDRGEAERTRRGAGQRRTEEIYTCLRDRICLLHYPPGTKLSEQELAREFNVSRTPIRRALHRLELELLAERRQGVQTVVTSFDFESAREVYVLRMILAENTESLSPVPEWWQHVDDLRGIRSRFEQLRGHYDLERFGTLHLELQEQLASMIGNGRAREITMQLFFQIARISHSVIPSMNWDEEIDAVVNEINALVDAMEHRDIRALGLVRRNAIAMSIERMRRTLHESEARPGG